MTSEHFDVVVVGAGISGIGAGYHLQTSCPDRTYAILEARDRLGGTWDLFRYPGIRSDSDMYTLGYSFKPWTNAKAIADGDSILAYLGETAAEHGIDRHIRFGHRVKRASWSSADALWTVEAERGPQKDPARFTCSFLFMCSGYYDYAAGYTPELPGTERFRGRIVHPQQWPDDVDYAGKRVVVIGSGATAVTLVPEMAKRAAHVTMLQRSPTYVVSMPEEDRVANALRRVLPARVAYGITRWKNVLLTSWFYRFCRRHPQRARAMITRWLRRDLGPDFPLSPHFEPRYNPWEQRVCLVPDGDFFKAMQQGHVSVVTDRIETFTETGLKLRSGVELPADLIVTATGLNLLLLGGVEAAVDGARVDFAKTYNYKGMMFSDVPNLALAVGYTNASWTLKAELICRYVCRLLNHLRATGMRQCTPRRRETDEADTPFLDLTSGYVQRSIHLFPKQGTKVPWRLHQNYARDVRLLRHGSVEDGVMEFSNPAPPARRERTAGMVAAGSLLVLCIAAGGERGAAAAEPAAGGAVASPPPTWKSRPMPDYSLFGDEHVRQYEATGGKVGHDWNGTSCLILRTKGRKSGETRKLPLIYGRDGSDYVLVASKGGAPENPGWYRNLVTHPDVEIQVRDKVIPVRARTATPEEKRRLWPIMTKEWPDYDKYQRGTARDIPVVLLSPR